MWLVHYILSCLKSYDSCVCGTDWNLSQWVELEQVIQSRSIGLLKRFYSKKSGIAI